VPLGRDVCFASDVRFAREEAEHITSLCDEGAIHHCAIALHHFGAADTSLFTNKDFYPIRNVKISLCRRHNITKISVKRMSKYKGKELSPMQYFDKNGKEIKAGIKILMDEHIAIFLKIGRRPKSTKR